MPIIRHTLEQGAVQADGGTQCVVRMYDQFDEQYTQAFYAPSGFGIDARIADMKAQLSEQLAVNEFETLVGAG
jgi:hypothetical protein